MNIHMKMHFMCMCTYACVHVQLILSLNTTCLCCTSCPLYVLLCEHMILMLQHVATAPPCVMATQFVHVLCSLGPRLCLLSVLDRVSIIIEDLSEEKHVRILSRPTGNCPYYMQLQRVVLVSGVCLVRLYLQCFLKPTQLVHELDHVLMTVASQIQVQHLQCKKNERFN